MRANLQWIKRSMIVAVCVASSSMVDTALAEFWFEDFADGSLSDGGIDWRFSEEFAQTYDLSPDGLEAIAPSSCCAASIIADWTPDRQGWSIRTRGRLLQDHGFFGAGISRLLVGDEYAWNLVAADGVTTVGVQQTASDLVETDLTPFTEDVTVQLDAFDGVLRMWAWRDNEQPKIDSPPLVEDTYDSFEAYPILTVASFDGPSSAIFSWVAISTEHMPVHRLVPPSDLIGDIDADGEVHFSDFLILSDNFGNQVDPPGTHGDLNGDGKIDFPDFLILSNNFGRNDGTVAAVPEPDSLPLLLVGVCIVIARQRRERILAPSWHLKRFIDRPSH